MATEIYSNFFTTTLASGYTAGSGTCTVASMTGAPSATLGNWRLVLDPGGLNVALKVTAASGTTLTVTAEQNDASVASGKVAAAVVTKGALDAIKLDVQAVTGVLASSFVATDQSITSTSYIDLATADTATFTLTATTTVMVVYQAVAYNTTGTGNTNQFNIVNVDGSNVTAAETFLGVQAANSYQAAVCQYSASLAAGAHTIKIQHKVASGITGHWVNRLLWVIATP